MNILFTYFHNTLQTIISFEEEEAIKRCSEKDAEKFYETCTQIRKNMAQIAKVKSSNDTNVRTIRLFTKFLFFINIFNDYFLIFSYFRLKNKLENYK